MEDEGLERTRDRAIEAHHLWLNGLTETYLEVEPGEIDLTFKGSRRTLVLSCTAT